MSSAVAGRGGGRGGGTKRKYVSKKSAASQQSSSSLPPGRISSKKNSATSSSPSKKSSSSTSIPTLEDFAQEFVFVPGDMYNDNDYVDEDLEYKKHEETIELEEQRHQQSSSSHSEMIIDVEEEAAIVHHNESGSEKMMHSQQKMPILNNNNNNNNNRNMNSSNRMNTDFNGNMDHLKKVVINDQREGKHPSISFRDKYDEIKPVTSYETSSFNFVSGLSKYPLSSLFPCQHCVETFDTVPIKFPRGRYRDKEGVFEQLMGNFCSPPCCITFIVINFPYEYLNLLPTFHNFCRIELGLSTSRVVPAPPQRMCKKFGGSYDSSRFRTNMSDLGISIKEIDDQRFTPGTVFFQVDQRNGERYKLAFEMMRSENPQWSDEAIRNKIHETLPMHVIMNGEDSSILYDKDSQAFIDMSNPDNCLNFKIQSSVYSGNN